MLSLFQVFRSATHPLRAIASDTLFQLHSLFSKDRYLMPAFLWPETYAGVVSGCLSELNAKVCFGAYCQSRCHLEALQSSLKSLH